MPQLRWTLLVLGVLFVVLLAWIERRRQRQQGFSDRATIEKEPDTSSAPMFREPALTLPEMRAAREPSTAHELPVVEIEDDSLDARRGDTTESPKDPSTLSLPVVESGPEVARLKGSEPSVSSFDSVKPAPALRINLADTNVGLEKPDLEPVAEEDGEVRSFNEEVFGELEEQAAQTDPEEHHERTDVLSHPSPQSEPTPSTQHSGGVSAATIRVTPADITPPTAEPIVDWPPDDQRRVVALRLVALPPEKLPGRTVRLALSAEGFVLGKFQIFHKPDASGRAVMSAANLSKPGTFDLSTMDSQRFSGLSLFMVLPGPRPALKAFEDLLATARNLNERLNGAMQDERGGPLTPARIAAMRESLESETPS
jgi:cell division protein ZipA